MRVFARLCLLLVALLSPLLASCSKPSPPSAELPALAGPEQDSKPTPTGSGKPYIYNRVVALCIGISEYGSHRVSPTPGAEEGAQAVAKLFREHYSYETVELLGKQATREKVLSTLSELGKSLGEKDALIIYFAGHGKVIKLPTFGRAGYLIPFDADLDLKDTRDTSDWAAKGLDMHALLDMTRGINAQHVLFFIDACSSGFMTKRGSLDDPALRQLMARRSRTVIAATTVDQEADARDGHSWFTDELRNQLSNKEAFTVTELFKPLQAGVARESSQSMLPQRGEFGNEEGEFVFVPSSIQPGRVVAALESVQQKINARSQSLIQPEHFYALIDAADYRFSPHYSDLETEWSKRFERFRENTQCGDPLALPALALCYAKGLGTEKDPKLAYKTARLACELGRPEGKYVLAYCVMNGIGTPKNDMDAMNIYVKLVNEKSPLGMLGTADYMMRGVKNDQVAEGLREELTTAAKAGVSIAEIRIVDIWLRSSGIPDDERKRVMPVLQKLAEAGNPAAMFQLYLLLGMGNEKSQKSEGDVAAALDWLVKSANCGYVSAQIALGLELLGPFNPGASLLGLGEPDARDRVNIAKFAGYAVNQNHAGGYKVLALLSLCPDGKPGNPDLKSAMAYHRKVLEMSPDSKVWEKQFQKARDKATQTK